MIQPISRAFHPNAATDQQCSDQQQGDRSKPQWPCSWLAGRPVADPSAIALDEPRADRARLLARGDPAPDEIAHVAGKLGVQIRNRLALADEAAELLHQRLGFGFLLGIRKLTVGPVSGRQDYCRPAAVEQSGAPKPRTSALHRAASSCSRTPAHPRLDRADMLAADHAPAIDNEAFGHAGRTERNLHARIAGRIPCVRTDRRTGREKSATSSRRIANRDGVDRERPSFRRLPEPSPRSTQGTHQLAKKLSSFGLPVGEVGGSQAGLSRRRGASVERRARFARSWSNGPPGRRLHQPPGKPRRTRRGVGAGRCAGCGSCVARLSPVRLKLCGASANATIARGVPGRRQKQSTRRRPRSESRTASTTAATANRRMDRPCRYRIELSVPERLDRRFIGLRRRIGKIARLRLQDDRARSRGWLAARPRSRSSSCPRSA